MTDHKLLIDGELVAGADAMDVINPATGAPFDRAPRADQRQLEAAIASARRAQPGWAALSHEERAERLNRLADAIEARCEDIGRVLTLEHGRPLAHAIWEVSFAPRMLRYFAGVKLEPRVLRETAERSIVEHRVPLGVAVAIIPWNVPVEIFSIKVGAALIAGNTVVLKPSPTAPLAILAIGKLAAEIFPPGVLNILVDKDDLGAALTSHPDVAKVSFTGSTNVGKLIMRSAADTVKRLTLELGGNDAAVVFDDVDIAAVAPTILMEATILSGQNCVAVKRLYVPDAIYGDMCAELARLADAMTVGDGLDPASHMGPVHNFAQFQRAQAFLKEARTDGKIVAGGGVEGPGYFVRPTIVTDIADDSRLVREEQFCPILPVLRYSDVEDAISRANDSSMGLGTHIWTGDPARAAAIGHRFYSGNVWINGLDWPLDVPFRGAKESGIGGEMSEEGVLAFTQGVVVNTNKAM